MTTIYLIRHAEAEGNLYRRVQGQYDSLITDNGFRQIKALERRFWDIPVDAVWSSDLYRTMTTARAVYVPKGLDLHTDPGLREILMGDWEDLTWGDVGRVAGEELRRFSANDPTWQAPSGESLSQAGDRVEAALRRIAEQHPGQSVAVFCHCTAIRQALANIKGVAPKDWHAMGHSDNTAVTRLSYEDGRFRIVFESDTSHLDSSISTLAKQTWWRKGVTNKDINLWYRPIRWPEERELYLRARREAAPGAQDAAFLREAETLLAEPSQGGWALTAAMAGEEPVGIILADMSRFQEERAGYIRFLSIFPEHRGKSLGVQLIGQEVSAYRRAGRDRLRLHCSPKNPAAWHFFAKYGFVQLREDPEGPLLEKYIGYNQ